MPNNVHSYSDLQQQIHEDLRIQHPDWVAADGNCPTCDAYESRLAELLRLAERSNITGMGKIQSEMSHAA
jgi:hypothetical protein